jgi:hypothetical protein
MCKIYTQKSTSSLQLIANETPFFIIYPTLGKGYRKMPTFRLKHRADNIAGVRKTRELPVPLRNPAHSSHFSIILKRRFLLRSSWSVQATCRWCNLCVIFTKPPRKYLIRFRTFSTSHTVIISKMGLKCICT